MVYNKKILNELELSGKTVFLRLDLNVPVDNGVITSYKRINSTLPTIKYLLDNNAKVVILSHFGRPSSIEDIKSGKFSLEIVAKALAAKIGNFASEICFISENKGPEVEAKIASLKERGILVLENTRFNDIGLDGSFINFESGCNEKLARYWAGLCDVFVNDAYGAAHRQHASTYGIAKYQPNNAIGFLMNEELKQLTQIVNNPIRPLAVIFGGAKVSDKSKAVEATLKTADKVIISGGMAYTFLAAQGYDMGLSKVEYDFLDEAKRLLAEYPEKLVISSDFLCSPSFSDTAPVYRTKEDGLSGYMGLDIGEKSIKEFEEVINSCNSILWNGPMGVTEFSHYTKGTNAICDAIAKRTELGAFTVIGGGDSAAAAEKLGKQDSFSWISTGGGASLVLIEGKNLAGIDSISESLKKKIVIKRNRIILDETSVELDEVVDMTSDFNNVYETIFPNKSRNNQVVVDIFEDFDEDQSAITQDFINEIYSNKSNIQEHTYTTDVDSQKDESKEITEEVIEQEIEEIIEEVLDEEIIEELVEEFEEDLEEIIEEAAEEIIEEEIEEIIEEEIVDEIIDEVIEEEIIDEIVDELIEEETETPVEETEEEMDVILSEDPYIVEQVDEEEKFITENDLNEENLSFEPRYDEIDEIIDVYRNENVETIKFENTDDLEESNIEEEVQEIEEPTEEIVDEVVEEVIETPVEETEEKTYEEIIEEVIEYPVEEETSEILEPIQEEKTEEIQVESVEDEEEIVPNVREIEEEEQKHFSQSEYDEPIIYSQIESEIIQLEPEKEKEEQVIELDLPKIKTQKKKGLSNAAIKLQNLIKNQRMNLQKIQEEKEHNK